MSSRPTGSGGGSRGSGRWLTCRGFGDLTLRSGDGRFGIYIPEVRVRELLQFCESAGNCETGGILVGHYNAEHNCAVVTAVSGPPEDSSSGPDWFVRGVRGLQSRLARLWHKKEYYIGEWHFHPGAHPEPSREDSSQMLAVATSEEYHCPEPLLLVVGNPEGSWRPGVFVYLRNGLRVELAETVKPGFA